MGDIVKKCEKCGAEYKAKGPAAKYCDKCKAEMAPERKEVKRKQNRAVKAATWKKAKERSAKKRPAGQVAPSHSVVPLDFTGREVLLARIEDQAHAEFRSVPMQIVYLLDRLATIEKTVAQ